MIVFSDADFCCSWLYVRWKFGSWLCRLLYSEYIAYCLCCDCADGRQFMSTPFSQLAIAWQRLQCCDTTLERIQRTFYVKRWHSAHSNTPICGAALALVLFTRSGALRSSSKTCARARARTKRGAVRRSANYILTCTCVLAGTDPDATFAELSACARERLDQVPDEPSARIAARFMAKWALNTCSRLYRTVARCCARHRQLSPHTHAHKHSHARTYVLK